MFETPEDRIDQMLIYKYRAEMAYRLAHYPLAIKHYQDCVGKYIQSYPSKHK